MGRVYVGDTGTKIKLFCVESIASASDSEIRVRKPSGAEIVWPAQIDMDTNSLFYIIPAPTTLDEDGDWLLQAYPNLAEWKGLGATAVLTVLKKFTI